MSKRKSQHSMYDPFRSNPKANRTETIERMYQRMLTEWTMTRFKWEDLPDTIDARFLEMELFYKGVVLFYRDEDYERHLAVRAALMGPTNMYDNPTKFRTIDMPTYQGKDLLPSEAVPIWGSYSRIPARDVVLVYARRLAELDVTLETNARNMRINKFVVAEEGERMTITNALRQMDEGQPAVFMRSGYNLTDSIHALDLGLHPQTIETVRLEKNQVWNECMTMLGITNTNQDKKERMVSAEATGSDGQVLAARNSAMKPRMEAADQINKLFNLNVSVKWDLNPAVLPVVDPHMTQATIGHGDDLREVEDPHSGEVK